MCLNHYILLDNIKTKMFDCTIHQIKVDHIIVMGGATVRHTPESVRPVTTKTVSNVVTKLKYIQWKYR